MITAPKPSPRPPADALGEGDGWAAALSEDDVILAKAVRKTQAASGVGH